jgi:ABC-type bacteriocin/lantibiotic exporter with double-glycine peptidase domain
MHLQCRNIHFNYPGSDKVLFDNLTIDFKGSGLHALFGPSGVGKSSLARIFSGLLQPETGSIHLDRDLRPLYTHNVERLPGWSSVGRHLERITPEHNIDRKTELIRIFGLESLLNRRFAQLSLGQQNRVNLLRYLTQQFSVLIMDESLANVDEKMRGRILLAMKDMFAHAMFIYISHNVVEVAAYCRQIWVLRQSHKNPQAVLVNGQDRCSEEELDNLKMQGTMLEIMHVA